MPSYNGTPSNYLLNFLRQLETAVRQLQTQQNWGVTDASGRLRLRCGLQPDGTYGLWMLNPANGDVVAKLTGTALIVYNATGTEEVLLGAIGSGEYGLQVRAPTGAMQLVAGTVAATVTSTLTYGANSWGMLSGAPSVTAKVGPSGSMLVGLGALIAPGSHSSGETARIGVALNTTTAGRHQPVVSAEAPSSSPLGGSYWAEAVISGLDVGATYKFGVQAWVSTSGVTADITNVTIKATPL